MKVTELNPIVWIGLRANKVKLKAVAHTDIYKSRLLLNQNKSGKLNTFKTYLKEPIFSKNRYLLKEITQRP